MGGFGSGSWSRVSKKTIGYCLRLDVRLLQRENVLNSGSSLTLSWPNRHSKIGVNVEADRLHIHFIKKSQSGDVYNVNQNIFLTWTDCRFGGKRAWFLCPIKNCGKRVAILYGDDFFACRHCQNLTYISQQSNAHDRAFMRADAIRGRMGWEPGIVNGIGKKPKGMHWRIYWKTIDEYNGIVSRIQKSSLEQIDSLSKLL